MGNPLLAFALVAEEYEKSGDPIRGLKPLFAPLLSDRIGQPFNADEFAERFKSTYGLEMTPFIANALKELLSQIGLLEEIGVNSYVIAHFEWSKDGIDEHQIDQTINLFCRWAKDKLRPTSRQFEDKQLEEAILSRLARPAFSSIFIDEDPREKTKRLKGLMGIGAIDSSVKDDVYLDYLVADFVLTASESATEVFDAISKIAFGSLIADAVAGLATTVTKPTGTKPLRVVLDSPLILDVLDINTPEHKVYAQGLLDLMRAAEINLAVFDHSIDEMRGTIRSTLQAHQNRDAYGPLAERLRTNPAYKLYATSVMDSLETRIKDLGITILRSALYEETRYKKYFPEERVDQVRNMIGDLHEHLDARIRDALSVATVVRLKGEQRNADSLFEAGTIFVTRNSVLVRRVNKALSIGRSGPDPRFTIISDGQIAGVLWFVSGVGNGAGEELSRRRLIANCSSAVLPKREVISRIAGMLDGLSPELKNEFEALMTDRRASLCPMRLTIGMPESIDAQMSLRVLESMKEQLVHPLKERVADAEAQLEAKNSELQHVISQRIDMVSTMQGVVADTEARLESEQQRFDHKLAQLQLTLELQDDALKGVRRVQDEQHALLDKEIADARSSLNRKERIVRLVIEFVGIIFVAVPSVFSIIYPDNKSNLLRILLISVYIVSFKYIKTILDKLSALIVSYVFFSKRSFIAGLERAKEQLPSEPRP